MVQLQVEAEKLQLSCNVLPTGLAPEGIKLSNLWIQLAHESKGLIAQDYLQGKVDEAGLLQLEVHRLGINELGRYRLIVKYSYESPERSAEGRTKYECILPAFEVLREERSQRLGTSELVAQGIIVQPLGLPTASVAGAEPSASDTMSPELLETLQALKRETALDDSQEFSYHPERMTEASLGQESQRVTLALRTEWLNQRLQNLGNLIELQRQDIEQIKQGRATADTAPAEGIQEDRDHDTPAIQPVWTAEAPAAASAVELANLSDYVYNQLSNVLEEHGILHRMGEGDISTLRDLVIIEGKNAIRDEVSGSQYGRILTQADYDELKGLIQSLQSEVASLRQQVQSK